MAATGARQLHGREPAIEHQHDTPLGEPAADLEDHLLHAIDRRLVRPPPRRRFGPTQDGQEWQRLDRLFQGSWTRTIIATHFSPKHLTTTFREDRTASR